MATLIRTAIDYNVANASSESIVTAHVGIDYSSSAQLDDWVEAEVMIICKDRRICFVECTLRNGSALMARASCMLVPVT